MRRGARLFWVYLVVGGGLIAAYFLSGAPRVQNVVYEVIGGIGVAAILYGVRLHRPVRRSPWFLLATGVGLLVAGDITWTVLEWTGSVPFPSVADAVYLSGFPFLALGVLRLRRPQTKTGDRARLVETAIISTGVALVAWHPLIESSALDSSLSPLERFVSLAYPLVDLLLIAVLVRLAVGVWSRTPSYFFLVGAVLAELAADIVYSVQAVQGTYYTGNPVDAGWLIFYVLIGSAALHPSMRVLSEPTVEPPARLTRGRLGLLTAASLMAPALIAWERSRGHTEGVAILLGVSAFLFLLVVARMLLLVREVESKAEILDQQGQALQAALDDLHRVEAERRRLLERTLRAAEEERIRIAADIHDGPIQRLASHGYALERVRMRLQRGDVAAAMVDVEAAQQRVSEEVQGLRRTMASLRPPALDEQGLAGAIRDHVAGFADRTGLRWEMARGFSGRLDPETETVLYRVAQEALVNVGKHARASRVEVELSRDNGTIELAVRDDGAGFEEDLGDLARRGHFGIVAMRELVRLAGGACEIDSRLGRGTTVRATIPTGEH